MSKYYRVMLYDLTKEKGYVVSNNMGYIIVKESMFHLKDVMTNYHLGIIHKGSQMCNVVENVKLPSCGHLPIIYERDLTTDNYATEKDVDEYIEKYNSSDWKEVYEEIQRRSGIHMKDVARKVRAISRKKK